MADEQKQQISSIFNMHGYSLREQIGEGGYGFVFKAENNANGQECAIKILPFPNDENDRNAKYPKRELEILKRPKNELWTENIVRYYGSWQSHIENTPFLCIQMELCLANLEHYIYDIVGSDVIKVSTPKQLWAHVFPQILNGLNAIHQIGWVHRDIHPGNILVANPQPQQITEIVVKIADFGLSREIGSIFKASLVLTVDPEMPELTPNVGHKLFRAPELATKNYDYKVDLFSAGIVLYFLSRYLPTKSQWPDEIKELRNGNRGPQHLSHKDEVLANLIDRLMKEKPDKRPTADMALKYIQGESKNLTEKEFLVRKKGHETYYRCTTPDASLESLKTAIQEHSHIAIQADAQTLEHETTNRNRNVNVGITSDKDARDIFASAERDGEKVSIVVTVNEPK
ncbi:interferon-induced, double-stranded RNA-activated protein kinase-like [Dendronephthya gigantea]|uniref:interferon-induced, double-stranded RNA-activated protein kinase-like n=1 Tax=Dendronephthya gigantea TaxID=151771 RepID=UPI00106D21E8|nr:interferon-induced, double-stranded RNA-activated protein kinase-like [Dendronephthya gigantea]